MVKCVIRFCWSNLWLPFVAQCAAAHVLQLLVGTALLRVTLAAHSREQQQSRGNSSPELVAGHGRMRMARLHNAFMVADTTFKQLLSFLKLERPQH
ncbi:hypothetical protein COO60DRAFT_607572 [Scenedesmus sp. NREL 46B-D3]|nr:hypothetical protein COO60DRAFT_607572 [Scenedesmus sp. NREL 46B-D3]